MEHRYLFLTALELEQMGLCDIDGYTKQVTISEAGEAVLEGRDPTLRSLIRTNTKD